MYQVVCAKTGDRLIDTLFPNADEASIAAKKIAMDSNRKVRISRFVDDSWRVREAERIQNGTYTPLPSWWVEKTWWQKSAMARDHYTHLHPDGQRIRFTESAEKGMDSVHKIMGITSYLGRFFGHVISSQEMYSVESRILAVNYEFKISDSADDFERVYENQRVRAQSSDAISCMHYPRSRFDLPHHPARAYAGGNLSIAWIEKSSDPFEVFARAVVSKKDMYFVRIYGIDEQASAIMEEKLVERGFRRYTQYRDATIGRLEMGEHFLIVPYIDGQDPYFEEYEDCLKIVRHGEVSAKVTEGKIYRKFNVKCQGCGANSNNLFDTGEWPNRRLCETCYFGTTFFCQFYNSHYPTHAGQVEVLTPNGLEVWCREAANYSAFRCDYTGRIYARENSRGVPAFESIRVVVNPNNRARLQTWCKSETEGRYFHCEKTNANYTVGVFTPVSVLKKLKTKSYTQTWCLEKTRNVLTEENGQYIYNKPVREPRVVVPESSLRVSNTGRLEVVPERINFEVDNPAPIEMVDTIDWNTLDVNELAEANRRMDDRFQNLYAAYYNNTSPPYIVVENSEPIRWVGDDELRNINATQWRSIRADRGV